MTRRSTQSLQNKSLKMRYLDSAQKFVKQLQDENEQLKTNPDTLIGQVIPQLREAIHQNKKLSVLAASLIQASGGSITVSKAVLESFESKVLNIKWAVPDGVESVDAATELIFRYEALTPEEVSARQAQEQVDNPIEDETSDEELTREEKAQKFIEESGKEIHTNDCATSVAPAEEPGPCDCTTDGVLVP
jgi:hypothetical protein